MILKENEYIDIDHKGRMVIVVDEENELTKSKETYDNSIKKIISQMISEVSAFGQEDISIRAERMGEFLAMGKDFIME